MSGEVFQIATGVKTSIAELARMIQVVAGKQADMSVAPFRQGDIRENYSQVSKARELLNWRRR